MHRKDNNRRKTKDKKKKEHFEKNGKYTSKHLRLKQALNQSINQ